VQPRCERETTADLVIDLEDRLGFVR